MVERVLSGKIEARKLESMVTHTLPLEQIGKAYEIFSSYPDGVIKIAIGQEPGHDF